MSYLKPILIYAIGVVGVIFMVLGITFKYAIFPNIVESQIYETLDFVNGTEEWDSFVESSVPTKIQFSFFNIENPKAIRNGKKPKVKEYGPYVYVEVDRKENIFDFNDDTLMYSKYKEYHFSENESKKAHCKSSMGKTCKNTDKIVILNPTLLTLADLLRPLDDISLLDFLFSFINNAISSQYKDDLFNEASVEQILYTGYEAGIIDFFMDIKKELETFFANDPKLEIDNLFEFIIPNQIGNGKFAFFNGKNASRLDNWYEVGNGRYNKHDVLNIKSNNGMTQLPKAWWPWVSPRPSGQYSGTSGFCHKLTGTDGTQFSPFLNTDHNIWLYVSELCRPIWMEFDQEIEVRGITTNRYRPGDQVFKMNGYSRNYCYCPQFHQCAKTMKDSDEWDFSGCKEICRDGMLDVSQCYGAPIVMSRPHFLGGDKSLINAIDGISPNRDKHDTTLDIEPSLGTTLDAHKRIQVSLHMKPLKHLDLLKKVSDVVVPVFWADEGATLDEENADKIKSNLITPSLIVEAVCIAFGFVLGPLLIFAFLFIMIKERHKTYK